MARAPSAGLVALVGLSLMEVTVCLADSAPNSSTPTDSTQEMLQAAADLEFRACAQALRERLQRAEEGDALGANIVDQALKAHRTRFLDLRRALARLSPGFASAAADRNPFEPDFHASPQRAPQAAATANARGWDLYAHIVHDRAAAEPSMASAPGSSNPGSHWGMYGSSASARETPVRPFLVYRVPTGDNSAGPATDFRGVFQSAAIHTKE